MTTQFGIILDILTEAFKHPVSEHDYTTIVGILRDYSCNRNSIVVEQHELTIRKFPPGYHPCDHMENIRFAMVFGENNNIIIQDLQMRYAATMRGLN